MRDETKNEDCKGCIHNKFIKGTVMCREGHYCLLVGKRINDDDGHINGNCPITNGRNSRKEGR